mmetsp:Transcript_4434/g.13922  ORF Transcript_4434/g.13922 Transcript_4434/m.13922 type:complete len:246 (+) Transcript_4434:1-738(+)
MRANDSLPRPVSRASPRQRKPAVCLSPTWPGAKPTLAISPQSRNSLHHAQVRHRALRPNAVPAATLPRSAKAGPQSYCGRRAQWAAKPSTGLPPAFAPSPAVSATKLNLGVGGFDGEVPAVLGSPRPVRRQGTRPTRSPDRAALDQSSYALRVAPLRMLEAALKREMAVQPTAAHMRDPRPQLPPPFIAELNRHRSTVARLSSAAAGAAGTSVVQRAEHSGSSRSSAVMTWSRGPAAADTGSTPT